MSLANMPTEFQAALPVLARLEAAGFEAYFVGGSVRDYLLGQASHDVDIATSAYPAEVKELFPRTVDVGIEHGTVLVLWEDGEYEITTFRTESAYQDYRRPQEVTFVRSLAEDLKRRDFTINALALTQTGELIDLFEGEKDLANGQIRAVGAAAERFNEDALRMMRALRFASQLDFEIESQTLAGIYQHSELLAKISVERIRIEFLKLMLGQARGRGLVHFVEAGCYQYCPSFAPFERQLLALSQLDPQRLTEEAQVWLVTLAVLELPPSEVATVLRAWKNSRQMITRVGLLYQGLQQRLGQAWTPLTLFEQGRENVALIEQSLVYFGQEPALEASLKAYDALPLYESHDLAVTGQDLLALSGRQGGPWVGALLARLQIAVLEGEKPNQKESLLQHANQLLAEEG